MSPGCKTCDHLARKAQEKEAINADFAMMIGRLAQGIRDLTKGSASPNARALADKADDLVRRKGYGPNILRTATELEATKPSPFTPDSRDP